jgi:hypothetical protein
MANQGSTHKILQRTGESRSFESYEALHKYCNHNGSKHYREYTHNCTPTATDGAGTVKAVASSTDVTNKGTPTGLTIVAACDADTAANRAMNVYIKYISILGAKKEAQCTLGANATTETALTVSGVAVTDFLCFNQEDYGPVSGAATYGSCVTCSVALGAVTNLCIGVTGVVAGIADPDICYAHINTTKVYPLLADIYGVGSIWGEREADTEGDDGLVDTIEYATFYGAVKTATCTTTTTHTAIIRYIDASGCYVGDFFRVRTLSTTAALVKAHHVCDHD